MVDLAGTLRALARALPPAREDLNLPPVTAWSSALMSVVVGFGGTIALVIQALRVLGASVGQISAAVTALCAGLAVSSALLSMRLRMPIVLAWSVPGAALLGASITGIDWPTALGVFLAAGAMMTVVGLVPVLGRLAGRIPLSIASAMLAGVLLPFCLEAFRLGTVDPLLVAVLVGVFIVARQRAPLYALLLVLVAGMALTLLRGEVTGLPPGPSVGKLSFTVPAFELGAVISLAVPFFLVTLVSQNLAGLMVLRTAGYTPDARTLLVGTGVASMLLAPLGAPGVNLAAITAALCTNPEAHPDAARRWTVGVIYGGIYLTLAIFSPTLVRLFLALPHAAIAALAGLALVPALMGSIDHMLADRAERDAAILTFLATGSGLALFGLGAAFWGLAIGFVALGAGRLLRRN